MVNKLPEKIDGLFESTWIYIPRVLILMCPFAKKTIKYVPKGRLLLYIFGRFRKMMSSHIATKCRSKIKVATIFACLY